MSRVRVETELRLDGSQYFSTLERARVATGRWARSTANAIAVRFAGLFAISALSRQASALVRQSVQFADTMDKAASRIGIGVEQMQELAYAAKKAGVETETVVGLVQRLIASAGKNPDAFRAKGIEPEGMTSGQLIGAVNKLTRGQDAATIIRVMSDLGVDVRRSGRALNVLASDLDALGAEARKMGAVMSADVTTRLSAMSDQFEVLGQIVAVQLGPTVLQLARTAALFAVRLLAARQAVETLFPGWRKLLLINPLLAGAYLRLKEFTDPGSIMAAGKQFGRRTRELDEMLEAMDKLAGQKKPEAVIATMPDRNRDAVRETRPYTDALLTVGNFLGGAQNSMRMLAQQQVTLLRQIADNTRPRPMIEEPSEFPE